MPNKKLTGFEDLEQKIRELKPGDHLCCIYETDQEHRALLTPFIRQGLDRGEKIIYIVDARSAKQILSYLREDGLDVEDYLKSGQLNVLSVDESYMLEGVFDPDGMIRLLEKETRRALDEGYSALRATGEMSWALRGLPGSERLMEYESKLNMFFPGNKCLAICQYDRRKFKPEILLDVLTTHPIAIIGTEVFDNFYYMPPKDALSPDPEKVRLNNWLGNLVKWKRTETTLQESEKTARAFLNASTDSGILVDREGLIIDLNDKMARGLGKTRKDMIGTVIYDYFPADLAEQRKAMSLEAASKREPIQFEDQRENRWFENSVYPIINPNGEVERFAIFSRDITERKQAQEEMARLAQFAAKNPNPVLRISKEARILFANKASDIVLETWQCRVGETLPEPCSQRAKEVFQSGKVFTFEFNCYDGTILLVTLAPVVEEGYLNAYGVNITEHIRTEEALKAEKEFTETALNAQTDTFFVFEPSTGRAIRWNEAFRKQSGYNDEEIRSMKAPDSYYNKEDLGKARAAIAKILDGETVTVELNLITKGGKTIPTEYTGSVITDREGAPRYIIAVGRDITERRRAEQELRVRNQILEIFLTITDEQMYAEILNLVLEALKSEYGTFGYFNEGGSFTVPAITREIYWEKCNVPDKEIIFQRGTFSGIWRKAIKEKRTLYSNKGPFSTPEGHIPIKNTMVTPIYYRDKLLSVIHIANKATDYDEADKILLETIGAHIAPVLYARLERQKEEKDRKKAEKELQKAHDELEMRVEKRTAELRQSIDKLRETELRYRTVANFNYDWEYWENPDFTLNYVSPSCERLTGYKEEEFIDNPRLLAEIILGEDRDIWEQHRIDALAEPKFREVQFRIRTKDGEVRWIGHACRPVLGNQGEFLGFRASNRDITDRKKVEEALRESEAVLRRKEQSLAKAQRIAHLGNWDWDIVTNDLLWSDEIYRIFGLQPQEFGATYEAFLESVHIDDRESVQQAVNESLADPNADYSIEHRVVRPDGSERIVHELGEVTFDKNGKAVRMIGIVHDITERKRAEAELTKSREALRMLAGKLLSVQEEERRRLARELHDDLTQRLAVLAIDMGKLEGQLDSSSESFASKKIKEIRERTIELSTDIHDISRQLHPAILDDLGLRQAIQSECVNFTRREGIAINYDPKDVPLMIPRDVSVCLFRIVQEGLRNIAKYAKVKEASVSLIGGDGNITLVVRDSGVGFDTARSASERGVGLASMQERVRLIRGDFSIESEPGQGTVIKVVASLSGK